MKTRTFVIATVLALASVPLLAHTLSEDTQAQPSPKEMEAMMQRWAAACTPGAQHAKLAQFVGKWDTETRMWMGGPGSEPMTSKGSAEFRWQVEGRWLAQTSDGQMMGMPIKGFGLMGYDNFKQKYVGSHADSLTTTLLAYEGNWDQTGKVLLCFGLMDEPMTGEHDKLVKYVTRIIDPDKFVFEVHDMPIGESNTKVVEVLYTRRKA